MRLVQVGEPAPKPLPTPSSRRTSQQRRATRLASISVSSPIINLSDSDPPVTTRSILQSLPSSQILLHHLPSAITSFTPFIAPSRPPAIAEKLDAWQSASVQLIRKAVPPWLAGLGSVTDIWHVRSALGNLLATGDFEGKIREALDDEWMTRVKDVWTYKLDALVKSAETQVREAGEQIRTGGAESGELFPSHATFSLLSS